MTKRRPDEFIVAWQSSSSLDEVLEQIPMKRLSAIAKAARYRKKGVKLQSFRGRAGFNWDELSELASAIEATDND